MDNKFETRAEQLLNYAKEIGLNSIEQELALLPEGDTVARIGYLANAIKMDPGMAFDMDAPIGGTD